MTGLYGVTWGSSSVYWGQSSPVGQQGRLTGVSRTQPQASDQPVTPVTATPAVSREQPSAVTLTGSALLNYREGADPAEMAVRGRIQYLSPEELDAEVEKSKSAQEVMEEGECQTCKERKYQDGSNDPGVSFKTPTNVAPEQAAGAGRGPRDGHMVRGHAKAHRE